MNLWAAYGGLAAGVTVWAVLVLKLRARPWEAQLASAGSADGQVATPAARIGLWIFLAVITSLFGLFVSAYYMRMGYGHGHGLTNDWRAIPEPKILWLNTAALIVGSIAMQWARAALARGETARSRAALTAGGVLTIAFLIGQLIAWRELRMSGFFTPANPAVAFFYVLTAVHALHLLGGLFVWGRSVVRMRNTDDEAIDVLAKVRLSVELCTVYWHYLLFVWLVLFALLLTN
jgi:cytochrome c oxidase subunit 3